MADIMWIAVMGTVVVNVVIGMIWFGPLFGKKWMSLVGLSEADMKGGAMAPMVGSLIGALLTAIIFSKVTAMIGVDSMRGYIETALWIWLGFTAISSFVNASFSGKSKNLWAIEAFFWFFVYLAMAVIFAYVG